MKMPHIALALTCSIVTLGAVRAGTVDLNPATLLGGGKEAAVKLLEKYAATRNQLGSFVIKDRSSWDGNAHFPPNSPFSNASGHKTSSFSEELRFDGTRYKLRQSGWGQIADGLATENNPHYRLSIWDGKEGWSYQVVPWAGQGTARPQVPSATLSYGSKQVDRGNDVILGAACKVYFLLGYFPLGRNRVDTTFREASSLSVRKTQEVINGSSCFVIDADSRAGRGSIWVDPGHGYLIAKAEYHLKDGDILDGRTQQRGAKSDFLLSGVRFKLVDGTWVTVAGTVESHKVWPPDCFIYETEKAEISEINLAPDFSSMTNAFALEGVREGAPVKVQGEHGKKFVWRNGKIQPVK